MAWIFLLKSKSSVFLCICFFHKLITTQFDAKVKILRTDNEIKYNFNDYLDSYGILHQTSCQGISA